MKNFFYTGLFLFLVGTLFHHYLVYSDYRLEHVRYKTPHGYEVEALLYLPSARTHPPVIIPCHGVISTKEMMHAFSVEMCRGGYAVLVPDLKRPFLRLLDNIDFTDYITGGIKFLRTRKDVDSSLIALMGHSWGADIAYSSAVKSPEVKTVISYGMSIYTVPSFPPGILLACGAYDLLHPPGEMLAALRESSGIKKHKFWEIRGDMKLNTARELVVSPLSDHSSEIIDPVLILASRKWLDLVFGFSAEKSIPVREHYRLIAGNARNFGAFICLFYLSFYLISLFMEKKKLHKFPVLFAGSCFILMFIMKLSAGFLPYFAPDTALLLFTLMLWNGFMFRHYFKKEGFDKEYIEEKFLYTFKFVFIYFILLWFSFILSLMVIRIPFFFENRWFLKWPFMFVFKFFTDGFFYFSKLEPLLGISAPGVAGFFSIVFPITILEAFRPGFIVGIFVSLGRSIFRKRVRKLSGKGNIKSFLLMSILLIVALIAWVNLITRGIVISQELLLGLAGLFFEELVLPVSLLIVFYGIFSRFSWFLRIS